MRIGVVTFPGSLDDHDAARAVRSCGGEAGSLWHRDADLHGVDAVVLPGGFSYGDYLRAGAISRFAPVMDVLVPAAKGGLPVLGICNGFQILCESHLLPGAMIQNVVDRAKKRAIKELIASGRRGLRTEHLLAGVAAELLENEDLPNTSDPASWARVSGRRGEKVVALRSLVDRSAGEPAVD